MPKKNIKVGPHLKITDDFLKYTVLRLIPHSVSPNSVTVVRFISVPVVITLLLLHSYGWGAVVFAVGVFTDALDGAMARTRDQITWWGTIADPLADKLLIGTTALFLVTHYVNLWTAMLLVCIELFTIVRAIYLYVYGRYTGASVMGKIKMVLQSIAILALFIYVLSGVTFFLILATWGLYAAIFFAFMSLFSTLSA